jgi:hypothetical protein
VELEDGRHGIFDVSPYLEHGAVRELSDEAYFNRVGIVHGSVTWPHGQDIDPETLVAEMSPVSNTAQCE